MTRNTIISLIALCLLAAALVACSTSADGRDRRNGAVAEPTPIPTTVAAARPTYEVARGDIQYTIDFNGRVAPVIEQPLAFDIDGTVGAVFVERGDTVAAGDVIAELDTSAWDTELALAKSALEAAQAQLAASEETVARALRRAQLRRDLAQLDLDHAVALAGSAPSPQQQYEIDRLALLLSLAQLDVDEFDQTVDPELAASVEAAALRVAEIEHVLERTRLVAPFDGVITTLQIAEGRALTGGEPAGAIADLTEIEVAAAIREAQLEELVEDMQVIIFPAGRPGDALSGLIRQLPYPFGSGAEAAAPGADQSARIQFLDMDTAWELYEPGDRVNVIALVTEHNDVLWLPPAAIRDFNGRKFVVVQDGETQQRVDVTLGIEGDGRVEIVDGLTEGQIVAGQ